jgi:hypothetical protein
MMGREHNYLYASLDSRSQVVVGVYVIKLSKRHERKMVYLQLLPKGLDQKM